MHCINCGNKLIENAKFCNKCGSGVSSVNGAIVGNLPTSAIKRLANFLLDRVLGGIASCFIIVTIWGIISLLSSSGIVSRDNGFIVALQYIIPVLITISLMINPFYYLFFEGIWGRTLGKWITKTKVVDREGNKPKFTQILGRSFARWIPFEYFSFILNNNPVGWHDSLSKTLVVPAEYTPEDVKKINFNEAKKQKTSVVIIVVIVAILFTISVVGILSSIVLASLNSARAKGQDAVIKSSLANIKAQAEIYWDSNSTNGNNGNYFGLCNDTSVYQIKASITKTKEVDIVCNDNVEGYAISAPLSSGGYWCVDNLETGKEIPNQITSQTSCSSSVASSTTSDEIKKNFIKSCVSESTTYAYCSCSVEGLLKKLGTDGFIEMSNQYDKTGVMETEVSDTIASCNYLLK
ncbi:RDD family protein [Candidatus Nomurabacteria bacterium]|nr:RDD family protein [Candidatus Nomurabacteria bacterium]